MLLTLLSKASILCSAAAAPAVVWCRCPPI
jgi:hypothetical protein